MALLDLQRRMRELGRIRTGVQVESKSGRGKRPEKLETFRLTSPSRELLDAAAEVYGGTVHPWASPAGPEWELVTKVDRLDIILPPGQAMSQWWELWSGGGCQRRCDGVTNVLADEPCSCPPDQGERRTLAAEGRACKPTTRLNVILPAIPDIGIWRLESHGYYAAVELAGTADFLERATASGRLLPARLRLDQREVKRPGQPPNRFTVPVIELPQTRIADFIAEGEAIAALPAGAPVERERRGQVERPALGPAPELPEGSDFVKPDVPMGAAPEPEGGGWTIADPEEAADGPALTVEALRDICVARHVTKGTIAEAFPQIGQPVPTVTGLTEAIRALSDEERGKLAVALGLVTA